ncbi:MAG: hypothetical protein V9E89_19300 [Ilumatobacteraceae bacterium]
MKRGGRKEMQLPDRCPTQQRTPDSTLVKALARAFRWKRMLKSGEFATIAELAEREGIAAPYLTRTMRLSHLSPDLVESILEGRQPSGLKLEALRSTLPMAWSGAANCPERSSRLKMPSASSWLHACVALGRQLSLAP